MKKLLSSLGYLAPLVPLAALSVLSAGACASKPSAPLAAPPSAQPTLNTTAVGIDLAGIDKSVAPGDDFFAFANGSWLKNTDIPADRGSYGTGSILTELNNKRTRELIEEAAHGNAPAGSESRKIADTYASFMDEAAIEARGAAPLKPVLDQINAIFDKQALARWIGTSLRADVDVINSGNVYTDRLFGLWIAQDLDDPSHYSPFLLQGGLGLPDREYYLDVSPHMSEVRTRYQTHIAAMLKLANIADADAKAQRIFELERKIAQAHVNRVDTGDVVKGNNHWSRREFALRAPGLDWDAFFAASSLDKQNDFVVWQPSAVTGISALVREELLGTWKDYLVFRAINRAAPYLSRAFVEQHFEFHAKTLAGVQKLRDRWKRGVQVVEEALGEAVGKLYVARYFPASEKARLEEMVKNEIVAFGRRIDQLSWMSAETKSKAKAKLAVLKVGAGYPDRWRDYSDLEVVPGDPLGNLERSGLFQYRRNLKRLGQPVDRGEWVMNPQLVNAVNLPAMNAMNFPAGILQPPYMDPNRPSAMDYGSIGAVIGHEISHSFDDQGAQFDATGRMKNWWTPDDLAHFKASAQTLVQQYDAYRPFPDLALNGQLTLGENIADIAGLAAAYDAYQYSLAGKPAPVVAGLTGDQQFFLSFAQTWRTKTREASLRQRVVTDGHSPGEYRADTVRNLDAWYSAFNVQASQKLFLTPQQRVRIW